MRSNRFWGAEATGSSIDETDVNGFNLAYAVTPETVDFVDLVMPELRPRRSVRLRPARTSRPPSAHDRR
jgi:hypothetical protein